MTYYWDFYGPRAEGTARHFAAHLEEFLRKHALTGCEVATASEGPGHMAASCRSTPEARPFIEGALRPARATTPEE